MSKRVVVFIADGTEEIECIATVDVLRRAGAEVTLASAMDKPQVECANGTKVVADAVARDVDYSVVDMVVLPGGMPGTTYLGENETVCEQVKAFASSGKWTCAICAAPMVLGANGVLQGKNATCYPGCEDGMTGANYTKAQVEVDGNIITANGPGAAFTFALKLVEKLFDEKTSSSVAADMQYL